MSCVLDASVNNGLWYCNSNPYFFKNGDFHFSYNVTNITVCQTDTNSFRNTLGLKLSDCVPDCGLQQHCKALSYGRKLQMCKLFLTKDDVHFINEDCIYITDDNIKVEMVILSYLRLCWMLHKTYICVSSIRLDIHYVFSWLHLQHFRIYCL